jgi:hypothetical protein
MAGGCAYSKASGDGDGNKVIVNQSGIGVLSPENRKTGKPENRKTGKPENRKTGKPENRKTGKPENSILV